MVPVARRMTVCASFFQYSLCRVVLMVTEDIPLVKICRILSVLALSSRFDGLDRTAGLALIADSFSTRSVESF